MFPDRDGVKYGRLCSVILWYEKNNTACFCSGDSPLPIPITVVEMKNF